MQPPSLAHHQLDSLPRQRDRLWLLPCAGHLWPAAQRAPYKRRQVKSGYVSPPLGTGRQHIQSTVAGEGKGQQGGGGGGGGVLANASSQWKTIGFSGMCLENKGLVHMLSLHLAFSFSLFLTFSTSQTFVFPPGNADI